MTEEPAGLAVDAAALTEGAGVLVAGAMFVVARQATYALSGRSRMDFAIGVFLGLTVCISYHWHGTERGARQTLLASSALFAAAYLCWAVDRARTSLPTSGARPPRVRTALASGASSMRRTG